MELQRVAIAACLARPADLYILDEPSAHLDVEQRVRLTKVFRGHVEGREAAILVVYIISERLLVFNGVCKRAV